jgi:dUTP pyrophosphatase
MKIKLLDTNAKIPTKGTEDSAGYDLYSLNDYYVYPQERTNIRTGIVLEIPKGIYGRIAPRSGLANKNGIDVLAGVIDSDYRGEIGVILYNTSKDQIFTIKRFDRIAQIIFEKYFEFEFESVEHLEESTRGSGGFGSTGS